MEVEVLKCSHISLFWQMGLQPRFHSKSPTLAPCLNVVVLDIKGLVDNFQIKMSLSFTHPYVILDVYVYLSSVEKKWKF